MGLLRIDGLTIVRQAGPVMFGGQDQKAEFDYWYGQVHLRNLPLIGAQNHVPTQELRHECTNYDELR
jgi:hypothetical protein